jgi:hypothetical protein
MVILMPSPLATAISSGAEGMPLSRLLASLLQASLPLLPFFLICSSLITIIFVGLVFASKNESLAPSGAVADLLCSLGLGVLSLVEVQFLSEILPSPDSVSH